MNNSIKKNNNINILAENNDKNKNLILEIKNVSKSFSSPNKKTPKNQTLANDDISINIYDGETLGLVGESGCGKSTLGKCILKLFNDVKGEVIYHTNTDKINLLSLTEKEMRPYRNDLQLIFQDPFSSLNPSMTVYELISEGPIIHNLFKKNDPKLKEFVYEIMKKCGLDISMADRYPHQFSGGQRQRICIARCLATNPRFIVCDEAVSALDVSIQAQILNLLKDLKVQNNLTYLFISHNISVVKYISDRIAVMYNGKIIEIANTNDLFEHPQHPYTIALLNAIPGSKNIISTDIEKKIEDLSPSISGCSYYNKCPYRDENCVASAPALIELSSNHYVACHKCKK